VLQLTNKHNYSPEDARILAAEIFDPYTRCAICGVPSRWLKAKHRDGWWHMHFRCSLTVDHIDPEGASDMENTRILCFLCNRLRGAAALTDEEVLRQTGDWYGREGFTAQELWWLCTSPGYGGHAQLGTRRIHPGVSDGRGA
jgi:hypothetical protein